MGVVTLHTPLSATEDIGWFINGPFIYRVVWNRTHTHRYALHAGRDADGNIGFSYEGIAPLHHLTEFDRVPATEVARIWAQHGPYDSCAFCHRPLTDPISRAFGVGPLCARNRMGVSPIALEAMSLASRRLLPARRDPAPGHRHLRLVAVNGRRVA